MTKKYNYTEKTGRPTKYDPSFIDEIDKYIASTGRDQTELPTKEGFALHIGVDDDTLDNWANAKVKDEKGNDTDNLLRPEFFGALKKLMLKQRVQLINDGIYGGKEVNATIVKLLLQNNHGYKEKSETDITSKGNELKTQIVIVEDKPEDS